MRNEKFIREFDWKLLLTFVAIVEEGSITAAAQRLLRTQPSVSNALIRLEASMGHRLLQRRKGRMVLTENGALLFDKAMEVCRSLEQIGDLGAQTSRFAGKISLQIASHMVAPVLEETIAHFCSEYPGVTFYVEAVPSKLIVENLMEQKTTIGLCVLSAEMSGLNCHFLNETEMGFFCGAKHPLFGKQDLEIGDLDNYRYISFESDHLAEGLGSVAKLGIGSRFRENRVAVSPNDEEVLRLIEAGLGFGPLLIDMSAPYVETGRLWRLPPYDDPPRVRNYVVTNPKVRLSVVEALFVDMLKAAPRSEGQDVTLSKSA